MTNYIVTVFLFLLMFSSGVLGNDQCDASGCPLELQLKEGKGEVITSGHFNLLWIDADISEAGLTSSEDGSNADEVAESSAVKDALLDHQTHSATHLKIATDQSFSQINNNIKVHSTQRAISLTGFNNGHYYVRLFDSQNNPLSNVVEVNVKHHSMERVWFFFISGAVLFLILIGYMVAKVFRHKEE